MTINIDFSFLFFPGKRVGNWGGINESFETCVQDQIVNSRYNFLSSGVYACTAMIN